MVRAQATQEGVATELIMEVKKQMYDMIKKIFSEGQKKGVFNSNVDSLMMVNTLVGTTNHMVISEKFVRKLWNMESSQDDKFRQTLKDKISAHLKNLFKVVLTNEC